MTTLPEIAAQLLRDAEIAGLAHQTLARGLKLSLSVQDALLSLLIARRDVPPSARDVQIVRNAFNVPHHAAAHPSTQGRTHYVRVSWSVDPASFSATPATRLPPASEPDPLAPRRGSHVPRWLDPEASS